MLFEAFLWPAAASAAAAALINNPSKETCMTSAIGIIPPEVSRHVHVIFAEGEAPCAGIISAVIDDRRVSVAAFTADGYGCALPNIHLRQPDEASTDEYPHARWMPYSVKQVGFVQAELVEEPAPTPTPAAVTDPVTATNTSSTPAATPAPDAPAAPQS